MLKHLAKPTACGRARALTAPPVPPNASLIKRWKFRRNLVIFIAHQSGVSQRLLADVFDLPRSRIAAIVTEFCVYSNNLQA